jgi:hypothetical protein
MDLDVVASSATIAGGTIAVTSLIVTFVRWSNRKLGERIMDALIEATYPISPTANGGNSLPDVARKCEVIEKDLAAIKGQVDLLVRIYTEEDK